MKLRLPSLPFRSRQDEIPSLGISDPGPAFRIIEPPDEIEEVRRIPLAASAPSTLLGAASTARPAPPPPLEAGYRWGMAAAQQPCDMTEPDERALPERVEVLPAPGTSSLPAPRFERAVLAVAARTEVLASAVNRLQTQLDEIDDRFVDVVHHGDLVELEGRRAMLAAEVSRLSVELKAEMDRRLGEVGRAIAASGGRAPRVDQLGTLDLADSRRAEVHLDQVERSETVAELGDRRTA